MTPVHTWTSCWPLHSSRERLVLCFKVYGVVLFVVLVEHSGAVFQNVCVVCNDTTLFMPQHGVVYALPATMMDALFPSPQQPALQKLAGLTVHAIQSHVPFLRCLCPAPSTPFVHTAPACPT